MTVLAILAFVCCLAFTLAGQGRQRGDHVTCAQNLHELGAAAVLYANDHDGWVPPATTLNMPFRARKEIPVAEIEASPSVLRAAMNAYVKSESLWFCPADLYRGQNVMWLGQRHRLTSYYFLPLTEGERTAWPPRMQIGRDRLSSNEGRKEDVPLFCDAIGVPAEDSDRQLGGADDKAHSNHPDDLVNAVRHDLSLSRLPISFWLSNH